MKNYNTETFMSKFAFSIMILMHDNFLLSFFANPYGLLKNAGLRPGQHILEVGCGPGFFTIPASEIVGDKGVIYAVDIRSQAIERVRKKMNNQGIRNIRPLLTNASDTDLPDKSIDTVFIFGLPYFIGGQDNVISEMHRILKPGGILSFKHLRGSETKLVERVETKGMKYLKKVGNILLFEKRKDKNADDSVEKET